MTSADLEPARKVTTSLEFLATIFGKDGNEIASPGLIEIRAFDPTTEKPIERIFSRKFNELFPFIQKHMVSHNVYFGCATRKDSSSGEKDNLCTIPAFWVDCDFIKYAGGEPEIRELIKKFPLPPSIIVRSGGGLHLYWILKEPEEVTNSIAYEEVNYGLKEFFKADTCWSAEHIMRLPGTTNFPTVRKRAQGRREAQPCVIDESSDLRYCASDFDDIRHALQGRKSSIDLDAEKIPACIPARFYEALARDERVRRRWEGDPTGLQDTSRSGFDMSLAAHCQRHHFTAEETFRILREFPYGRGKDGGNGYFERTIARAFGDGNELSSLRLGKAYADWKDTPEPQEPVSRIDSADENEKEEHATQAIDISQVQKTITKEFSPLVWRLTEAGLVVTATLLFRDMTNPKGLVIEGNPSTQKTTFLYFFEGLEEITYTSDQFTPRAFLSHAATIPKKKLAEIDLLPRIRFRVLIVPELSPIFGKRPEDLQENISLLIRVFDGKGLSTDSGSRGRRSLVGDYYFAMLAATTPIEWRVWKLMGKLGSRLLVLGAPEEDETPESLLTDIKTRQPYSERCQICREAVHGFLKSLWQRHGGARSVAWDNSKDDDELVKMLAHVALFATTARSVVSTWKDEDSSGYSYSNLIREGKRRLTTLLYDLARARALLYGRGAVNLEDIAFAAHIGLSSMPKDRRLACQVLLRESEVSPLGEAKTSEVEKAIDASRNTAVRLMETLAALGTVYVEKSDREHGMKLESTFSWFTQEDGFLKLVPIISQKFDAVCGNEEKEADEPLF
jgi:hypothetical protein